MTQMTVILTDYDDEIRVYRVRAPNRSGALSLAVEAYHAETEDEAEYNYARVFQGWLGKELYRP